MQTKKKIRHYASRGELSFPWLVFLSPIRLRATREVLLLITWHTVRPNKLKRPSLEQRKVYCRAKQGERLARAQKNPNSPMVFCGDVHIGKIWGKGCRACDFRLIGWWWDKDAPGILYSASTWVLSSCKRTQRYCYVYSLRRNQNLAPRLHYCFFFFFLELKYDFIATFLKILFIYLFIYF